MTVTLVLRAVAIAIAVAALIDPALTRDVPQRERLTIVTMDADDVVHAERLQRMLAANHTVSIHEADPTSLAAACPSSGGCILVSHGDVPRRLTAGAHIVGALQVTEEETPRVIRRVDLARTVHRDAAASMRVGLGRPVTRVEVLDGGVVIGSAEPGDALDVDIAWVPLAEGARALTVVAGDDRVDIGVVVDTSPAPVFVYEPEPTWMGTFVRRALDDDPRFTLAGRTRVAPPVTVTRGGAGPLSAAAIGDAGVIVVTAPQRLQASDVELLDRFVTSRGGSLIVIHDQRPSGAMLRLLPRVASQQRDTQPRDVGLLKVREWLTFEPGVGTTTLAADDEDAVVISRAVGRGRVIASGALDSWRFRDADSNFSTFWTALAWDAAMAAGERLHVTVEHVLARSGEPTRVTAELQAIDQLPMEATASGALTCDGREEAVRLWPEGRPGTFEGLLRPSGEGECELTVAVSDATTTVPLVVRGHVRRVEAADDALSAAVAAHGSFVVDVGDGDGEAELGTRARATLPAVSANQATWPMRSPYWMILFAACLGSEWWLRRRSGLN
jgi:hypothetical protein